METIIACFLFEFPLVVFGRVAIATRNCFLTTALRLVSNLMIVFSSFPIVARIPLSQTLVKPVPLSVCQPDLLCLSQEV